MAYYNPLLGGGPKAPTVMLIGWGEGLDEAAAYLNTKPNAAQLHVASWYSQGGFSYFFKGEKVDELNYNSPDSVSRWLDTDYFVTYIQQVIKNFFSAKTYLFELKVKDRLLKTDAYFISIANSNQFGNNFKIAPKASLTDGLLDIVIVTSQSKLSVVLQTIKQVRGKNKLQPGHITEKGKGVIYFQTEKLIISNPSLAPLHIDGDPAETAKELKIEIKKHCFRLIQPV